MSVVYTLYYRSRVTGRITGEVYESLDELSMYVAVSEGRLFNPGKYVVFKSEVAL